MVATRSRRPGSVRRPLRTHQQPFPVRSRQMDHDSRFLCRRELGRARHGVLLLLLAGRRHPVAVAAGLSRAVDPGGRADDLVGRPSGTAAEPGMGGGHGLPARRGSGDRRSGSLGAVLPVELVRDAPDGLRGAGAPGRRAPAGPLPAAGAVPGARSRPGCGAEDPRPRSARRGCAVPRRGGVEAGADRLRPRGRRKAGADPCSLLNVAYDGDFTCAALGDGWWWMGDVLEIER